MIMVPSSREALLYKSEAVVGWIVIFASTAQGPPLLLRGCHYLQRILLFGRWDLDLPFSAVASQKGSFNIYLSRLGYVTFCDASSGAGA